MSKHIRCVEKAKVEYEFGMLYVSAGKYTEGSYIVMSDDIIEYLSTDYKHTANVIFQLSLLLANKPMCIEDYYGNGGDCAPCIFIKYDADNYITLYSDNRDEDITFQYNENEHRQAFEDILNDLYFNVGYKFSMLNTFKQKAITAIMANPNITKHQFNDIVY